MVPILFTFDDSLVMPAGVCLTSLLVNANPGTFYDIYIIHSDKFDFSNTLLSRIPEVFPICRINYIKISGEFIGAYEVRGIPETAYYRLLSPELILNYDKIIYSDVDVIFREDLTKYYEIDLGENYFAGTDNVLSKQTGSNGYVSKVLGLDAGRGYFYSGNLIINLKKIRAERLTNVFRQLGKNEYLYQDMDIINIACNGKIKDLGPVFCMAVQLYEFIVKCPERMLAEYSERQISDAISHGIVHYNGIKPWRGVCQNMDIWWYYYRKSLFFDESFCFDFWFNQQHQLESLSLWKRLKLLIRYPKDKKHISSHAAI